MRQDQALRGRCCHHRRCARPFGEQRQLAEKVGRAQVVDHGLGAVRLHDLCSGFREFGLDLGQCSLGFVHAAASQSRRLSRRRFLTLGCGALVGGAAARALGPDLAPVGILTCYGDAFW